MPKGISHNGTFSSNKTEMSDMIADMFSSVYSTNNTNIVNT